MKTPRWIIKLAAGLFIFTCLFLPWQFTEDVNGERGYHSRTPAGYAFILDVPANGNRNPGHGVVVDGKLLVIEWVAILGLTSALIWLKRNP